MRIAFNHHFIAYLHAAGLADAPHVVAAQVDEHNVFGDFFGIGQQALGLGGIFFRRFAAQASAGDGAHGDLVALAPHKDFGRRADDVEIAEIVVKQIGRGIERAQGAVEAERFVGKGQVHALAGHHLHTVAV